ncbi:RHS repeat-associated core domain-containing protein [Terriglobus albidus]|uniref:RHS repeat-associated core domain-containing protein n=1 Tax=Terriglobus albidus TaxID=1592106 RepID=A0A5B9E7E8_9BACT|nr:RHS repeat-associated core domain-containing protein [Terriglobus albidus]QEE27998.1 RHS repeat-associated core domain-containing protein [Terriglobus albidus]
MGSTNLLYDRSNAVQEISGGSPTANLLTGYIDEYFVRTDMSGTFNFLTDALGSTVALTDASGTIQTQYAYDPFGITTQSGNPSTNILAFTGRELDAAGLYYFRARYYNPAVGRFLSEDPAGFSGGINKYAYVGADPIDFNDPSGRLPFGAVVGAINGGVFGGLGAMTGDDWDWQDVVGGAVLGAAAGFGLGLLDPTEGAVSSVPISAGADLAGQAFHKWRHGQNMSPRCYNWGEVAGAGVGAGLGGGLGVGLEALGAEAGLTGNALTFAESLLAGNASLISTATGGGVGNAMKGRSCGCQ